MFFLNYSLDLFPSFWILNFYLKLFFCRVIVDNCSCQTATLVKVDSSNRHGILLEVVQILTDLDLWIRKAYISSDGGWFMDGQFTPLWIYEICMCVCITTCVWICVWDLHV